MCRVPAPRVQSSVTLTGDPRLRVVKRGNEQVAMERLLAESLSAVLLLVTDREPDPVTLSRAATLSAKWAEGK